MIIFFACNIVSSVFHYLFTVLIGRMLGPAEFGVFSALITLLLYTAIPFSSLQNVVTQSVATWTAKGQYGLVRALWVAMRRDALIVGVCISLCIVASAGGLQRMLKLSSPTPLYVLATVPIPMLLLPTLRGMMQGAHTFIELGVNMILEGFGRVAVGVGLVYMGFQSSGALGASTASGLLAVGLGALAMRPLWRQPPGDSPPLNIWEVYGYAVPVMLTQLGFAAMAFMDISIVKIRFDPVLAGYYAGAETLGKVVFFLPTPLVLVMFPRVAALEAKGLPTWPMLMKTMGLTSLIAIAVVGGYAVMPEIALRFSIGLKYAPSIPLLVPMGLAMTGFTLTNVLLMYHISRKSMAFLPWFLAVTLLQGTALMMVPNDPAEMVLVLAGCGAVQLAVQMYFAWRSSQQKKPVP